MCVCVCCVRVFMCCCCFYLTLKILCFVVGFTFYLVEREICTFEISLLPFVSYSHVHNREKKLFCLFFFVPPSNKFLFFGIFFLLFSTSCCCNSFFFELLCFSIFTQIFVCSGCTCRYCSCCYICSRFIIWVSLLFWNLNCGHSYFCRLRSTIQSSIML